MLASSLTLTPTLNGAATPERTPRPTSTPTRTRTPLPTLTPTATPGLPFELQERKLVCDQAIAGPLIQVETFDVDGIPIPGVAIIVTWPDGEDRFFTGLKPELGLGYADFTMTPGVSYDVQISDGGETVPGLVAEECVTGTGDRIWASWSLVFTQPEP